MYGMVNQAIEQMVCETHGDEAWEKIKEMAGIDKSLLLHYYTHREGLAHFVVGLVRGLGKMFKTPATMAWRSLSMTVG